MQEVANTYGMPVVSIASLHDIMALLENDTGFAEHKEAVAAYRTALSYLPRQPLIHFNLGVALEDAGASREALDSYHACIELAPDFADAHYNAARLHEALGDPHRAIRHYNQYRKLDPVL